MRFVEFYEFIDIYITHAISISKHKFISLDIVLDSFDPASSHGSISGIDQCHFPIILMMIMDINLIILDINGNVIIVKEIIRKPFFDHISLISQTDNKIFMPVLSIVFHDVPENWLSTNFYHRLRLDGGFF